MLSQLHSKIFCLTYLTGLLNTQPMIQIFHLIFMGLAQDDNMACTKTDQETKADPIITDASSKPNSQINKNTDVAMREEGEVGSEKMEEIRAAPSTKAREGTNDDYINWDLIDRLSCRQKELNDSIDSNYNNMSDLAPRHPPGVIQDRHQEEDDVMVEDGEEVRQGGEPNPLSDNSQFAKEGDDTAWEGNYNEGAEDDLQLQRDYEDYEAVEDHEGAYEEDFDYEEDDLLEEETAEIAKFQTQEEMRQQKLKIQRI